MDAGSIGISVDDPTWAYQPLSFSEATRVWAMKHWTNGLPNLAALPKWFAKSPWRDNYFNRGSV
jgi:hypothetical protein